MVVSIYKEYIVLINLYCETYSENILYEKGKVDKAEKDIRKCDKY